MSDISGEKAQMQIPIIGAGNKKRVVKLLTRRDYSSVERPNGGLGSNQQTFNAQAIVAAAVA